MPQGIVVGYARSGARQYPNMVIVRLLDSDAASTVGCEAVLNFRGIKYLGTVLREHGKWSVIVRFRRNLPGQAVNSNPRVTINCS